jgi:Tfp pilus assembly protein PilX
MRHARNQDGIALISAIIILMILLGLGVGALTLSNSQQQAASNQQGSETAYSLAEAALNAQIFQLSVQWPSTALNATGAYPYSCGAASAGATYCPDPTYLSTAYPNNATSCSASATKDAWSKSGSPPSNGWTTYVRDAGAGGTGTQQLFGAGEKTLANFDTSATNFVWVRAVGVVNCQTAVVISKVNALIVPLAFPQQVLNANGFFMSNNGNKLLLDTQGSAAQPSGVAVRCNGIPGGKGLNTACTNYTKAAQVAPDTVAATPASPAVTLNATQLAGVKALAQSKGTYFAAGACPTGNLDGAPVYVEGPCALTASGNSAASPGYLVIINGTYSINGGTQFYGVVYAANAQAASTAVVTIHGNATITGGVTVDGNGLVDIGSSGSSLVFDTGGFGAMRTFGGAAGTPNTFRQLPTSQ